MKINKLLVLAVLSAFGLTANAQTKGPQKNDFNVALTLGYNSSVMGTAVDGTSLNYQSMVSQRLTSEDPGITGFGDYYGVIANVNIFLQRRRKPITWKKVKNRIKGHRLMV